MKKQTLSVTANSSGNGTAVGEVVVGGAGVFEFEYLPGTLGASANLTLTDEYNGVSFTFYTKTAMGSSNLKISPRTPEALSTDGSALTTDTIPTIHGHPKASVTSGSSGGVGTVILHLLEL